MSFSPLFYEGVGNSEGNSEKKIVFFFLIYVYLRALQFQQGRTIYNKITEIESNQSVNMSYICLFGLLDAKQGS